ncbi:MAG: glycosyltransferase [Vicinamibacteria bacterium]
MTLKTLHLTNAYHPTSGGIRTFYRALLAEAEAQERPMRLVVPGPRNEVEPVGRYGRIYVVEARPAFAFDRRYRLIMPPAYLRPSRSALVRILVDEQPDLVEICDKYTLFYLAALIRKGFVPGVGRPTLVGLSCERMDDNVAAYISGAPAARAFARWYIRHMYGPPFDFHIANSAYTAEELRQCLWDRDEDFVHVCPMGVDTSRFSPALRDAAWREALLARAGGAPDSVLLFYAGRLSPEKNVTLLVDTLAALAARDAGRDYRLVLAGDGPLMDALRADAAARAPGRLYCLGAVTDPAVLARSYASADVFLHPNPREPFGIGPLEAMASGVPVVLPAAGGVLSYATPDNAWLAAPDGSAFAEAVHEAVSAPRAGRRAAALATAKASSWPEATRRFFTLYDRLHRHARVATARAEAGWITSRAVQ